MSVCMRVYVHEWVDGWVSIYLPTLDSENFSWFLPEFNFQLVTYLLYVAQCLEYRNNNKKENKSYWSAAC